MEGLEEVCSLVDECERYNPCNNPVDAKNKIIKPAPNKCVDNSGAGKVGWTCTCDGPAGYTVEKNAETNEIKMRQVAHWAERLSLVVTPNLTTVLNTAAASGT